MYLAVIKKRAHISDIRDYSYWQTKLLSASKLLTCKEILNLSDIQACALENGLAKWPMRGTVKQLWWGSLESGSQDRILVCTCNTKTSDAFLSMLHFHLE